LALGALFLAGRPANWPFCLLIGLLYWLLAWPPHHGATAVQMSPRALIAAAIILSSSMLSSVLGNGGSRILLMAGGTVLGVAHIAMASMLAQLAAPGSRLVLRVSTLLGSYAYLAPYLLGVSFVVLGGLAGATLVGLYLVVSDLLLGWNRDAVFSSQSIIDYRSFVRMRIQSNGALSIFPIGLRHVPRKWRARVGLHSTDDNAPRPLYEPADDVLAPHLIEGPIHIAFDGT
jgi:hypothetical protein